VSLDVVASRRGYESAGFGDKSSCS
jgi:hypothetical protein